MNPDTNKLEALTKKLDKIESGGAIDLGQQAVTKLLRPDGTPVPDHWTQFQVGENVVIKDYTFKVCYIGETSILFEPVGPVVIQTDSTEEDKR